jgi:hypothetical protein
MGRHKSETPGKVINDQLPQGAAEHDKSLQSTVATAHELAEDQLQITRLVYKRMGRRDALKMMINIGTVTNILDLQRIKESKEYKGLEFSDGAKVVTITNWADYCRLVEGRSPESIDLDINNLNFLGEDLFESMRAVGIGPSKMREIRKLPDDTRIALLDAAHSGDWDTMIEFTEDLLAQHAKEKEALNKNAEETVANLDATRKILDEEKAAHQDTKLGLQRALRRIKTQTAEEADKELRQEAALVAYEAEVAVTGNLRAVCTTMLDHAEQSGTDYRPFLASMVRHLEIQLAAIRDEFVLPDAEGAEEFSWLGSDPAA